MKRFLLIFLLLIAFSITAESQNKHFIKIEGGCLLYRNNLIQVDPGPGWEGYNLNEGQNGMDFNLVNGIVFPKNKFFAGLGIGYQNLDGINGFAAYADLEYLPFNSVFSPLLNLKIGYDHIWNQYEGGNGTLLVELEVGVNYKLRARFNIFLKSGILLSQQSSINPIHIGLRF